MGADGKIDASRQDDDQHAQAEHTVGHRLAHQVAQVPLGEEDIRHRGGHNHQDDKGSQECIIYPVRPAIIAIVSGEQFP